MENNLYSVLIVEDESYIRNSLVKLIDWEELHCSVTGACESGEEALEIAEKNDIEIVVSDIKMEGMNGLDLAKVFSEKYPDIKIIFLTGHAEFDYARTAVRLNVVDFILKPTNPDELKSAVKKAITIIEKNMHRKSVISKLQQQVKSNIPKLRSQFLSDLIHGAVAFDESKERSRFLGIPDRSYYIVVCGFDEYNELKIRKEEDLQIIRLGLFQTAEEYIEDIFWGHITEPKSFIFVFFGENPGGFADNLKMSAMDLFEVSVSSGISEQGTGIDMIPELFTQARQAFRYRFYTGLGSIIFFGDIVDSPRIGERGSMNRTPYRPDLQELEECIETGDFLGVQETMSDMYLRISTWACARIPVARSIFLEILVITQRISILNEIDLKGVSGGDFSYLEVQEKETLTELFDYTINKIKDVCLLIAERNTKKHKTAVEKIIDYLEKNFSRPITLEDVGTAVFKSPKYICRLLKQEKGKTFSEILLSMRMDKAGRLLRNSDISISEISYSVGINDPHYFSKVFKKKFGVSPTEYRGR